MIHRLWLRRGDSRLRSLHSLRLLMLRATVVRMSAFNKLPAVLPQLAYPCKSPAQVLCARAPAPPGSNLF